MERLTKIFKKFIFLINDNFILFVITNTAWLVCCLPFIVVQFYFSKYGGSNFLWGALTFFTFLFIPVATAGLFYLVNILIKEKDAEFNDFMIGLKKYFLKSIFLCFLYGLIIIFIIWNITFYFRFVRLFSGIPQYLILLPAGAGIWILFFVIVSLIYVFPLMVSYQMSIFSIMKNAFLLELNNLVVSWTIFIALLFLSVLWIVSGIGIVCFLGITVAALESVNLKELVVIDNENTNTVIS